MGGLCYSENSGCNLEEETKETRITNNDMIILSLKRRKRDCEEYMKKMKSKILDTKNEAIKASKKKDKPKAIFALKLIKMFEKSKGKIPGMIQMIESTISNLEEASMNADILKVLNEGNKAINELKAQVDLKDFQEIYENMNENDEIRKFIENDVVNEEEYLEELEKLEDKPKKQIKPSEKKNSSTKEKISKSKINGKRSAAINDDTPKKMAKFGREILGS